MIRISGQPLDSSALSYEYGSSSIGRICLDILLNSSKTYEYNSLNELKFELSLREKIVNASMQLYNSRLDFSTFRESRCNPEYWKRTEEGGFLLKNGVTPFDAINDIYNNTRLYATECATAIVILYYKAIADVFPQDLFNTIFSVIYLMNWSRLDRNLGINSYRNLTDYLPGDCRYFNNPDVDPLTPEWQGENAIDLSKGMYYGHGIGIKDAERIIEILNHNRIKDSTTSAYLIDMATRPGFDHLFYIYNKYQQSLPLE